MNQNTGRSAGPHTEQEPSAAVDRSHAHVVLVAALKREFAPLLKHSDRVRSYRGDHFQVWGGFWKDVRVAFVAAGVGFAAARRATEAVIEHHSPEWVISYGFSGGLQPQVRTGDIVVGNELVDEHGQRFRIPMSMAEDPQRGIHVGRLLTADHVVQTAEEKRRLGETYGALAVDLESLAVAQVCAAHQTRLMAFRAVTDDVETTLPEEVVRLAEVDGPKQWAALAAQLWRNPRAVGSLWRLKEVSEQAAVRLARFTVPIIERLYDL